MGLAEVSTALWRERELLELLLFKLEQVRLVRRSGRTRWLARATREVHIVQQEIQRAELLRAAAVATTARELGLGAAPSLSQLAESAEDPWPDLLRGHHAALLDLTAELARGPDRTVLHRPIHPALAEFLH